MMSNYSSLEIELGTGLVNASQGEYVYTTGSSREATQSLPVPTCSEYVNNMSDIIHSFMTRVPEPEVNKTREELSHETIAYIIKEIAVPIMCVFGIVGNVLNLVVLTRKQLQCTMDRLEKSAHLGLVGLAVSDALFCLLYFLAGLAKNNQTVYTQNDHIIVLYYNIYHEPLTNIFLLSSTWLTVIMALGRYIAICHPFRARGFINMQGTRAAICCVYIGSILINLPKFWHYYAVVSSCDVMRPISNIPLPAEECSCKFYTKATGKLYLNSTFEFIYGFTWSILGIFIPLLLLTICNICLIRALRQSYRMQRMYRANTPRDSGHRITPTLITIIILFTILVTPSEILAFFKDYIVTKQADSHYHMYFTANEVANFFLLTNFSINFVLYCVINVQFRNVVRNIMCCTWRRKTPPVEYFKTTTHNSTTVCNISDMETEV